VPSDPTSELSPTIRMILDALQQAPVVPVVDEIDVDALVHLAKAAHRGGIRLFEVTQRRTGAAAALREAIQRLAPLETLHVGAGSVPDVDAAAELIRDGARFLVTPFLDPAIANLCQREGVVYVPGVMTPTEARDAYRGGAVVVKLFPASSVGPAHLKNLLAPMPYLRVMPTGGIRATLDDLEAWAAAGAAAIGLGSSLVPSGDLQAGALTDFESRCRDAIQIFRDARRTDVVTMEHA